MKLRKVLSAALTTFAVTAACVTLAPGSAQASSSGCNSAHQHNYYLGSMFVTDTDYSKYEWDTDTKNRKAYFGMAKFLQNVTVYDYWYGGLICSY
jgi:hypothetical protein